MKRSILWFVPLLIACGPFFFEAPPPLEAYPQHIPVKSWLEVFNEASPAPDGSLSAEALINRCRDLAGRLPVLERPAALAAIDDLIAKNREGDFRLNVANFLHELREIVDLRLPWNEAVPLVEWRLQRLPRRAGFFESSPERRWDWTDEQWKTAGVEYDKAFTGQMKEIDDQIATAPSMQPFWLVQRGALSFTHKQFAKAEEDFKTVADAHAGHPRAEVATFMLGRCALEESRQPGASERDTAKARDRARAAFESYRKTWPHGRFLADAAGWEAALALDGGGYPYALKVPARTPVNPADARNPAIGDERMRPHPEPLDPSSRFRKQQCRRMALRRPDRAPRDRPPVSPAHG